MNEVIATIFEKYGKFVAKSIELERLSDGDGYFNLRRWVSDDGSIKFGILRGKNGGEILLKEVDYVEVAKQIKKGRPFIPPLLEKVELIEESQKAKELSLMPPAFIEIMRFKGVSMMIFGVETGSVVKDDFELVLRFEDDPHHEEAYPLSKQEVSLALGGCDRVLKMALAKHHDAVRSIAKRDQKLQALYESKVFEDQVSSKDLGPGAASRRPRI